MYHLRLHKSYKLKVVKIVYVASPQSKNAVCAHFEVFNTLSYGEFCTYWSSTSSNNNVVITTYAYASNNYCCLKVLFDVELFNARFKKCSMSC